MVRFYEKEEEDKDLDLRLRPSSFDEYIGQEAIKANVRLIVEAAKERGEAPDHLLFYGQAGLGKTTLAHLIGRELGRPVRTTSGPLLERAGDMVAILSNLEPHDILFVDEVHRINRAAEEVLYPALESKKLHLVVGKGPAAKTLSMTLSPFTLVAATTKASLLSQPFRSRFGAIFKLDYYTVPDIKKILERSAKILGAEITPEAIGILAGASRFTPRVANRLLKRSRDYAQLYNNNLIDKRAVQKTLELLQVDELGLEEADRELLRVLINRFSGGPTGLSALAAALQEEESTISDVYEPYLMRLGFLERTRLGRIATRSAHRHLGVQR